MVRFVAELAFYLNRLSVAYDVVQILSAQCRNRKKFNVFYNFIKDSFSSQLVMLLIRVPI